MECKSQLRVGVFSGENFKIFSELQNFFRTSQKISKQYKTLKLFQNFVKELCLVVGGG